MILQKIISAYSKSISRNILGKHDRLSGLPYWQNKLFALILIYFLPLSLLAIVPGVIMSIIGEAYFLAVYDSLVLFVLLFISLSRKLRITVRKAAFIFVLYVTAIVLLYYLGSFGPGLLYLLAITIFTTIIFNRTVAYCSVLLNTVICIFFGFAIHAKVINGPLILEYTTGSWIAVSSNLILLSAVITALLPTIFKGLQITIDNHFGLEIQLKGEQAALKNTVEVIKEKNKELEEFAYVVSHDLQEPLRMVSSFMALLEKNHAAQLDQNAMRYVNYAKDGADRMKRTILDLLEYALAEKRKYQFESLDFASLVRDYVDQNREMIEEKKAQITCSELPVVVADKLCMQQLLQNLISNGIKYQRSGTEPLVNIVAKESNRYWEFSVSDNGIGIDPESFEKIFVVFQRLHAKDQYPGTGIGLAICKKIVANHKGRIWVESTPGKGSIFHFTISKNLN